LGELSKASGTVNVKGSIAYAPQDPWTFHGTIQENILFGRPHHEPWYSQVIEATALEKDLQNFSLGDATVIGERGTSLSGGQRARVSLARYIVPLLARWTSSLIGFHLIFHLNVIA